MRARANYPLTHHHSRSVPKHHPSLPSSSQLEPRTHGLFESGSRTEITVYVFTIPVTEITAYATASTET